MGCICGTESKVKKSPALSKSSIPAPSFSTKVEIKPFNRESHVSIETPSLYYLDFEDRDPSRGSRYNSAKVVVESFNRENDVSLEIPSVYYLDSRYRDPSGDCHYTRHSEHVLKLLEVLNIQIKGNIRLAGSSLELR